MKVHFSRVFSAAHRVWNDTSKCANVHGHNYRVEVDVEADTLSVQGFVVPFDVIKHVIDSFDHTLILDKDDPLAADLRAHSSETAVGRLLIRYVPGVPSTEFMAKLIADEIAIQAYAERADNSLVSVSVALTETEGITASAHAVVGSTAPLAAAETALR